MAILTKIKSATLIETLTASVLIVLVFGIASLSINSIFKNSIKKENQQQIQGKLNELYYLQLHKLLKLPYSENYGEWEIFISDKKEPLTIEYTKINSTKTFVFP